MQLKLHNEGRVFLITSIVLTIIIIPFFPILGFFFGILSIFIFYFFRDPIRAIPNHDVVVSPADGQIVFVGESDYPEELSLKNRSIKISIFLDLYNVHVNRIPISGIIKDIKYIPGKFFRANVDKSSKENERNIVLIENEKNEKIVVSQIAGLIARRIVCDLKVNQKVDKGDRFGIIKFGSRVDLFLPLNYKPMVTIDQLVIGGETILSNPNNIDAIKLKINK
ncbi:MAG: phosphatidylserine decarboxylase family protein [Pelagibacteraceae bacterium]|nr:phosphatidylserine decarboxylase family protein [Pelagibacteraceae bacterium]|tara:strand:- start:16575 stop:17243 length:669 start_codon:yes stop_codon:yes gene_type:complete